MSIENMGVVSMNKNEFERAGEIVKKALKLKREKDYTEAREILEAGLEEFPSNNYIKASLADLLYRMGQMEQALNLADEILQEKPSDPRALTVKGNVFLAKRKYEKAREFFEQAHSSEESSYTAYRLLKTLNNLEQYEEALQLAEEWKGRADNPTFFQKMTANIYEKMGKNEKADEIYQEYLADKPEDQFAYKEKIKLRLKDKSPREAVRELQGLFRVGNRDRNPYLHSLLAEKLEKIGEKEEALQEYKRTLELNPDNKFATKQAGFLLYKSGKYEQALSYLKEVFRDDPGDYYTRSVLINIFQELGKEEEGIEFLKEIIKNNPGFKNLWGIIKKLAKGMGERDDGKNND
jgi:tetratricopeptide (TPR) repeat protein